MVEIPVTWEGGFDAETAGQYTVTASFSGYTYTADDYPYALVTVEVDAVSLITSLAYTDTLPDTIETEDTANNGSGITISLYDYDSSINNGITSDVYSSSSDGTRYYFLFYGSGLSPTREWQGNLSTTTVLSGTATQGIVESTLIDGYPVLASNNILPISNTSSLAPLFSAQASQSYSAITVYENLTKLFTYDSNTKLYSFDASQNFATLNPDGQSTITSNEFTVYDTPNYLTDTNSKYFMPFDSYGEDTSTSNYHFGMHISMSFLMPEDGLITADDGQKSEMVFSFSGDDDVWIFIDDVLILDLGGIHTAADGEINFATGTVTANVYYLDGGNTVYQPRNSNTQGGELTRYIGDLLYDAKQDNPEWDTSEYLYTQSFESGQCADTTCAVNTTHTHYFLKDVGENAVSFSLDMFYLERGAGASNHKTSFNLLLSMPFDLELPILKNTLAGYEDGTDSPYEFTYEAELGEYDATTNTWSAASEEKADDITSISTASVTGVTGTSSATDTITIEFDEYAEGTYWFKVYEVDAGGYVNYDGGYYIVEVEAADNQYGIREASIQSVRRFNADGTQDTSYSWNSNSTDPLTFTNSLVDDVTIFKTDEFGDGLSGASFILYYEDSEGTICYYQRSGDETTWTTSQSAATTLTSGSDGTLELYDLKMSRTYYLEEVEAPTGYTLNENRIIIRWNETNGDLEAYVESDQNTSLVNDEGQVEIVNVPDTLISGLRWYDENSDGLQNESFSSEGTDDLLGMEATLLVYNAGSYEQVWDTSGNPVSIITFLPGTSASEIAAFYSTLAGVTVSIMDNSVVVEYDVQLNGATLTITATATSDTSGALYSFEGMSFGTYAVSFASDEVAMGAFDVTTYQANNGTNDSDGMATYTDQDNNEHDTMDTGRWLAYSIVQNITITADATDSLGNDAGFVLRLGSITITKTDSNGEALAGVTFSLEVLVSGNAEDDSAEWAVIEEEAITDKDGKIAYKDLEPGTYRLTEVGTVKGRSLLAESVIITLPVSDDMFDEDATTDPSYVFDGVGYWLDLGYDIENGIVFDLPMAGGNMPWWAWPLMGSGVITLGFIARTLALNKLRQRRVCHLRDTLVRGC